MYNINLQEIGDVRLEQAVEDNGSTDDDDDDDENEDEYDDEDCRNQYIAQSRSRSEHDTLVLFPIF